MTIDRDARRPGRRAADDADHSVLPAQGDIAAAVPESLTVSIALPVPVHESPEVVAGLTTSATTAETATSSIATARSSPRASR